MLRPVTNTHIMEGAGTFLKSGLLDSARETVNFKIRGLRESIAEIQDSANEETKSVAGDKYETARAMAHLEIEKLEMQLNDLSRSLDLLNQINGNVRHDRVQLGSVVVTSQGNFFLVASLGEVQASLGKVICISVASPLGGKLIGRVVGEKVMVNNRDFAIKQIF